jgi:hypothetical protein
MFEEFCADTIVCLQLPIEAATLWADDDDGSLSVVDLAVWRQRSSL